MHDRIDVIEVGFLGPKGELSPADRASVTAAIAAGDALAAGIASVTDAVGAAGVNASAAAQAAEIGVQAAEAAQNARDAIIEMRVETGEPETAATWDAAAKRLTVPRGAVGDAGASAYDLAVEAGFAGSVDDWLATLKGANAVVVSFATDAEAQAYSAAHPGAAAYSREVL